MKEGIQKAVNEINRIEEKENEKKNNLPCTLCGSKEFIQLFRNVVGEISGSMQGYFSLFGGSVSGRIDGYTKTLPVLSCKKCHNEREIKVWKYTGCGEWFWREMLDFYLGIEDNDLEKCKKIQKYFLERPVETRQHMLDNRNWVYSFYNDIPQWSTEVWAEAGFEIKPITRKFLWWEWKRYPTWEELQNLIN